MKYYIKNLMDCDQREADDISELDDLLLEAHSGSGFNMCCCPLYLFALHSWMTSELKITGSKFQVTLPIWQFYEVLKGFDLHKRPFPFDGPNIINHLNFEIKGVTDYETYSIGEKKFCIGKCYTVKETIGLVFAQPFS